MNKKLILVFTIISAIAAGLIYELKRRSDFALNAATHTQRIFALLDSGLWAFEADNGRLPTEKEGLAILFGAPDGTVYIKEYSSTHPPTVDAWRRAIRYEVRGGTATICSAGADGVYDTGDDIRASVAPRKVAADNSGEASKAMAVSVTVNSPDGKPVHDAVVAVTYHSGPTFRGNTGADGRVSIAVPGNGYSSVYVRREGKIWVFPRSEFEDVKTLVLSLDGAHESPQ